MKTVFKVMSMAAVGVLTTIGAARAQTVLTLSSWLPPTHPVVTDMIVPWTEQVKKATSGRVTVQILAKGIGQPKGQFDVARDGLADVAYSVHGYTPGRFLMTKVAEFPFLGSSSEALSVAYWKVHQSHLAKANEHDGTHLLSLFTHGPGHIHTAKKPVTSAKDLAGQKIRVGGGVMNDVAQALGAVPLLKPAAESYELLSNGVADGTFLPNESVTAFKVEDIVKHTTLVPGGLYNTSFFLVMNKQRFAKLTPEDQTAIMAISGEAFARMAGKAWDAVDAKALEVMKARGNQVVTADAAFVADVKARTAGLEDAWFKAAAEKGVDGKAALAELRRLTQSPN
ncbi:MAG TPA: TRAP transporter substrate-binding protein [Azospirillum sp.]